MRPPSNDSQQQEGHWDEAISIVSVIGNNSLVVDTQVCAILQQIVKRKGGRTYGFIAKSKPTALVTNESINCNAALFQIHVRGRSNSLCVIVPLREESAAASFWATATRGPLDFTPLAVLETEYVSSQTVS